MCLAPIMIDNPNYNVKIRSPDLAFITDTVHQKIPVPCGRCASCMHLKQIYFIQRVQMEALNHDLFYGTLTYNQDSLPIAHFGDISFAYPDYTDWQKMIKMIRKNYPNFDFKYALVSEYGGEKHRPHFHFILSFPRESDKMVDKVSKAYDLFNIFLKYWRRNYGSTRKPIWKPLCTYVRRGNKYNYDLHWLDPNSSKDGLDGVSFYVSKYILKYDSFVDKFKSKLFFNLKDSDYKSAWSLFRPRLLLSKGFGSPNDVEVYNHIRHGIELSKSHVDALFPYFVSRVNGSTYPLCPYYSKRYLNIEDKILFVSRRPDDFNLTESDIFQFDQKQIKFNKVKSFLSSQSSEFHFDDISDININSFNDYANTFRMDSENPTASFDWEDIDFDNDHPCFSSDAIFQ